MTKALSDLHRSFSLLTGVQTYTELLNLPLIPWDEIKVELDKPECREWMKTALAAYPFPREEGRELKSSVAPTDLSEPQRTPSN